MSFGTLPGSDTGAGSFITVPLIVPQPSSCSPGSVAQQIQLWLNVETSVAGQVVLQVQDPASGQPFPGWAASDAVPLKGNSIRRLASWKGGNVSDWAPFASRPAGVVINATVVRAKLYAWEWRCGEPGPQHAAPAVMPVI